MNDTSHSRNVLTSHGQEQPAEPNGPTNQATTPAVENWFYMECHTLDLPGDACAMPCWAITPLELKSVEYADADSTLCCEPSRCLVLFNRFGGVSTTGAEATRIYDTHPRVCEACAASALQIDDTQTFKMASAWTHEEIAVGPTL
eukprot:4786400-Amphidinium_carterae.1